MGQVRDLHERSGDAKGSPHPTAIPTKAETSDRWSSISAALCRYLIDAASQLTPQNNVTSSWRSKKELRGPVTPGTCVNVFYG